MKYKVLLIAFVVLMVSSCKKDLTTPNSYSGKKSNIEDTSYMLNPTSIEGLHQQIFMPKCATSGCHDGHFEPDFRTIQSTYTTLVRANVIKQVNPYKQRVVPGDTSLSWLWNRITTNDAVLGRMPLYSPSLTEMELHNIKTWILNGAKDMFGKTTPNANAEPTLFGYFICESGNISNRYDNIRIPNDFTGSMVVPENSLIDIYIGISDDSTQLNLLTNNTLKLSKEMDNFTNATSHVAQFFFPPLIIPDYFGVGRSGYFVYKITGINTTQWNKNDQVFMRYYVKDSHHTKNTELPESNSEIYWKTRYSLLIQ